MEVWRIHLRSEGDGPPMSVRVRKFLKLALRLYGLRCVSATLSDDSGVGRVTGHPEPKNAPAANSGGMLGIDAADVKLGG